MNLSYIYTFSFISLMFTFIFNNNIFYLANIISIFGFVIIIILYPTFFYNLYKDDFDVDLITYNLLNLFFHLLPIILFYKNKNITDTTFIYLIIYLLIYYLIFKSKFNEIYPLSEINLIIMCCFILFILFILYHYKEKILKSIRWKI